MTSGEAPRGGIQLPWGTTAWLPEECRRLRECEGALRDLFLSAGASEVAMPAFEKAEILEKGFGNPDKLFRFLDRDGSLLALRPELTTPAACLFASALYDRPLPLKLFYIGQVFRQEPRHHGHFREFRQAGFECYGGESVSADVAVLKLAATALARLGAAEAVIELGHVGIVETLLAEAGISGARRLRIKQAIARKDRGGLEASGAPPVLSRLLAIHGGETLFARAREVLSGSRALEALSNLEEIAGRVSAGGTRTVIEICSTRGIDYYTGLVFEGLLPRVGRPVLSGGRYDRLVEQFGPATPATGFSIELETIIR